VADPTQTNGEIATCVRCGEPLLGREPLCPHCQQRVLKALEVAGQPTAREKQFLAVARVVLLFAVVGSLGFLAAGVGVRATLWPSVVPWSALGALAASTGFLLLVGPPSIVESVRRAVTPGMHKLEATIGPSTGNRAFVVESFGGALGVFVIGDTTFALYRAGEKYLIDTREIESVTSVEKAGFRASALVVGEDASGKFGVTLFLRSRRPSNARRALSRALLAAPRKRPRRDESSSPRPAAPAPVLGIDESTDVGAIPEEA
jgi:hypothetical protein